MAGSAFGGAGPNWEHIYCNVILCALDEPRVKYTLVRSNLRRGSQLWVIVLKGLRPTLYMESFSFSNFFIQSHHHHHQHIMLIARSSLTLSLSLSLLISVPIVHHFWLVHYTTSSVRIDLMNISLCLLCMSMCRSP